MMVLLPPVITVGIHMKYQTVFPLMLQTFFSLSKFFKNPLVKLHVLNQPADGPLTRPFGDLDAFGERPAVAKLPSTACLYRVTAKETEIKDAPKSNGNPVITGVQGDILLVESEKCDKPDYLPLARKRGFLRKADFEKVTFIADKKKD